jgi:hypothetical protein
MPKARVGARSSNENLVVRGSIITLKRKCGTASCRCARHEPHATPALSYSVGGVTKMLTFRPEDMPLVRAALARYRRAQAALDRRALEGIAVLRGQFTRRRLRRVVSQ